MGVVRPHLAHIFLISRQLLCLKRGALITYFFRKADQNLGTNKLKIVNELVLWGKNQPFHKHILSHTRGQTAGFDIPHKAVFSVQDMKCSGTIFPPLQRF